MKDGIPDILVISVEGYIWKMIPTNCYKNSTMAMPYSKVEIHIDDKKHYSNKYATALNPASVTVNEYRGGHNFTISV